MMNTPLAHSPHSHADSPGNQAPESTHEPRSQRNTNAARGPAAARGHVRERILTVAHQAFSERDFPSVTVRSIAAEAGCDPGLISYYFGSKAGLFREAMSLPNNPVEIISQAFGDGRSGTGERVLLAVMDLWETAAAHNNFSMFVASLLNSEPALQMFRTWIDVNLATPLMQRMRGSGENRRVRFELAFSQILGLVATRYVYGMQPLASLPKAALASSYGPSIDATLAGRYHA
ncbi:MAG: TetR family transcriptional regulator [Actinomycetaceae bacterium]|nr:TetR family transcriptional regulator [Actinomycetaceae bacterium]MDY5854786.1 TetR family transcriptional regulator [Arcanobacterium sp.]